MWLRVIHDKFISIIANYCKYVADIRHPNYITKSYFNWYPTYNANQLKSTRLYQKRYLHFLYNDNPTENHPELHKFPALLSSEVAVYI